MDFESFVAGVRYKIETEDRAPIFPDRAESSFIGEFLYSNGSGNYFRRDDGQVVLFPPGRVRIGEAK